MKILALIASAFVWTACFGSPDSKLQLTPQDETLGTYTYELEPKNQLIRFKKNNQVINRKEFLEQLSDPDPHADDLRRLNNKLAASLYADNKDIKLKAPPISQATYDKPFFWLAQPHVFKNRDIQNTYKNYLTYCNPMLDDGDKNSEDNRQRFLGIVDKTGVHYKDILDGETYKDAAVFFINLRSGPDRLVIPCPFDADYKSKLNKNLLNIGSYAQYLENNIDQPGNKDRINTFWLALGVAANSFSNDNPDKTIFLHTHGTGTHYLHFRIDVNIYDYSEGAAPKLASEPDANKFYEEIFAQADQS